jgi:hypothetical protein
MIKHMKSLQRFLIRFSALAIFPLFIAGVAQAQSPYYYGSYDQPSGDTSAPPPTAAPVPEDQPPPVVYRRVPSYRPVYQAPAWASPGAAALAPWPWNFDFGGGPTTVVKSNSQLNGGSNFTFGGGYNFNPRLGWVLEFSNNWMGVTNQALTQNNAVDGSANITSITLNPIWRFRLGGPVGAYIIGGGGYYQREMRFVVPAGQEFIPFVGFVPVNEEVHQYDYTGGVNIGAGLTFNLGWGTKFFMEARYHYIFTSGGATEIIPVTFGLRW